MNTEPEPEDSFHHCCAGIIHSNESVVSGSQDQDLGMWTDLCVSVCDLAMVSVRSNRGGLQATTAAVPSPVTGGGGGAVTDCCTPHHVTTVSSSGQDTQ